MKTAIFGKNCFSYRIKIAEHLFRFIRERQYTFKHDHETIKIHQSDMMVMHAVLIDYINQNTGICTIKQSTIAKKLGLARQTVNKSLQKLKKLYIIGIIARYRQKETHNQHGKCIATRRIANSYTCTPNLLNRLINAFKGGCGSIPTPPPSNIVKTIFLDSCTIIKKYANGLIEKLNKSPEQALYEKKQNTNLKKIQILNKGTSELDKSLFALFKTIERK